MKGAVFITARVDSTRLPRKALAEILPGVEMLRFLIDRIVSSFEGPKILCTTEDSADDALVDMASSQGILVYRGSTEDKLDRWLRAAEAFDVDAFVTADGDDPFFSLELARVALSMMASDENLDYVTPPSELITGVYTYAVRTEALRRVCDIKASAKTEMIWRYFEDTGLFQGRSLAPVPAQLLNARLRLTVDYPEDLELVRRLAAWWDETDSPTIEGLAGYVNAHPVLYDINEFRQREWRLNQIAHTHLELKEDHVPGEPQ